MSEELTSPATQHDFLDENDGYFRQKPDGGENPAGEAGWFLQREREHRGLGLDEVGEATGVHPYHIEAIEYGDMTRMPRRMEALEMIGVYAQYLGFDAEPLLRHYARFLPPPPVAPAARHPANPEPLTSAKVLRFGKLPKLPRFSFNLSAIPGGAGGIVASVAGAIFLFAGASWMMVPGSEVPPRIETTIASADPMPTASTGPEAAEVNVTEEPMPDDQPIASSDPVIDDTAGTDLDGLTALIQQEVATTGTPKAAKNKDKPAAVPIGMASAEDIRLTPDGREFGGRNGGTRLVLKARAAVWVRIEDPQGNVVMTQMLMKGDTYRVPDRDGLVVIARDGGLLSYVIDGKEKGVLGTPGEILVGRSLDMKALEGNG